MINNWTAFWMGSKEDENKRIHFNRVGDQWKARSVPESQIISTPEPPAKPTPPKPPASVQTWKIVAQDGQIAMLTVDINGNFSGSGWTGSTPSGKYNIPITNGRMSGISITFQANASYDGGQGKISGSGTGTLNAPFPSATSAKGEWSGTISDPLGTRSFRIAWNATRVSGG